MTEWREVDHPRDADGQFTEKPLDWAQRLVATMGATDLVSSGATDWAALAQPGEVESRWRWTAPMHRIYQIQGFDAAPELVDRTEFRRRVDAGAREMWRGVSRRDDVGAFTADPHHPIGGGISGQGTYTTTRKNRASGYGHLIHMALKPDARVAKIADIGRRRNQEQLVGGPKGDVLSDMGRLAAALGYDAMEIVDGDYLVFNRGALIVEV